MKQKPILQKNFSIAEQLTRYLHVFQKRECDNLGGLNKNNFSLSGKWM